MICRVIGFLCLCLFAGVAFAASFDCKQSGNLVEKSICANQVLSSLDNKLAYQYETIRDNMPRLYFYHQQIKQSQRQWLKQRNQQCGSLAGDEMLVCLMEHYQKRTLTLENIINEPVSVQINQQCLVIDTQHFQHQSTKGCYDEMFLDREKLSQIMGVDVEQLTIFNRFIEPAAESFVVQCHRDYSDSDDININEISYSEDIDYINDHIVSVVRRDGAYTGGAHGMYAESLYSVDLDKHVVVTWQALFGDNVEFQQYVVERIVNEIADKAYLSYFNKDNVQLNYTINSFKETGYFNMRHDGLFIQYQPYMIGPYSAGLPSLTLSLQELKRFMTAEKYHYYFGSINKNQLILNCSNH